MIDKIKTLIFTDTGRDTTITFFGSLINVSLGGIFFILAPRFLGPYDYGLFSTIIASGVVAVRITSLGVETGILRFAHKDAEKVNSVLSIALKSYLILGFI